MSAAASHADANPDHQHKEATNATAVHRKTGGPSPELKASIFSILTWHWLRAFVALGNRKTIEAEDLYDLNPKEGTEHCELLWKAALGRASKANAPPSVWTLLWDCFGAEYSKAALFKPVWLVVVVLQVYILRALIKVVASGQNQAWWWKTLLVLGIFFTSCAASISQHMCFALSQRVSMKIRSTVCIVVYNKLLNMKLVSLVGANSGLMLNLVTNDTQKLLDATMYMHFVWFALVEISTISTLAIIEVGVSAVPGVAVAFLSQPLQVWMARTVGKLRVKAVKYTDSRVHLTGEILNGIRVIKYNGWIAPFLGRITKLRQSELQRIRRASFLRASTSTLRDSATPLASLVTFGTYFALNGGRFMPPSQAFTILALFSVLVRTFSIAPIGFQYLGEAIVAVQRLQKLLNQNEANDLSSQDGFDKVWSSEGPDNAMIARNCTFSWGVKERKQLGDSIEPILLTNESLQREDLQCKPEQVLTNAVLEDQGSLQEITLNVRKGELISIHGPVGSGKSSLLYGILGEMQCLKGTYFIQRHVAYVPQQPWILNDTVRSNILFISPYNPSRYQKTIEACALEHDISQFRGGHEAEIGDRGINLSGGQKARISLARACYSEAPVVLLDDPLAAVDVPTAKHLIKHVLKGILKGRTVVLVTHNRTVLDICDYNYRIEKGHLYVESNKDSGTGNHDAAMTECKKDTSHFSATNGGVAEAEESQIAELTASQTSNEISRSTRRDEAFEKSIQFHDEQKGASMRKQNTHGQSSGANGRSTVEEDRVEGNIQFSTWVAYGKASGGFPLFSFVMLVFVFGQAVRVMVDYWLRVWTDGKYNLQPEAYLAGYASFAIGACILSLLRALLFMHATMIGAEKMHDHMAERVLRSPQHFFDQNVAGRILNRFSKDQALVDELLPNTAQQCLEYTISSFGSLIIIAVLIPWFLIAFPPFLLVFIYLQQHYVAVSRELKRLEAITRSPMYAHFSQTLQGIVSVRAYGVQDQMHDAFVSLIDANHRSYILFVHMARWLGIRLDFVAVICVTFVSILVVLLKNSISPGLAGIVLVQSLQVTGFVQYAVRQAAETENYLTSVERIHAYCNLQSEADPTTGPGIIDKFWPSNGEIEFKEYTMTYREDLPPILNRVSFKVNAREKIGILGRTGVGKSSLTAALFRMVENSKCSGDIFIDHINIKLVGLDDLRQRLSIIPQDPILFEGSLRFNLDPFDVYSDPDIYEALSRVHLMGKIETLGNGLDSPITDNGANFSLGERQLICLARSLLRRSRIIVMDEATAAVDGETDRLIQATIRMAFNDCTVLTIAHRIDTVIDCDRIMILVAGGCIGEFDSPSSLLDHQKNGKASTFADMVHQTGPIMSKQLYEAAHASEERRKAQHNSGFEMDLDTHGDIAGAPICQHHT